MSRIGHVPPEQKMPKLIVVTAFNRDAEGDLKPVSTGQNSTYCRCRCATAC